MADATSILDLARAGNPADELETERARLEAEIALRRGRVASSLGELRQRVQSATSWRHWAAAHPMAWLGIGLALGYLLGSRGRRDPSIQARRSDG